MLMIYGAAGYTARLIVHELARRGTPSVIAGRDEAALRAAAIPGEIRTFGLADPSEIAAGLEGVTVLVNATGRYSTTALPLVRGCLARGIHYLDLAGEVPEHALLLGLADEARAAGVMLLPGVGFGVVPTELAAVEAAQRLGARPARLEIAYETVGGASRGTLETVLRQIHQAGVQRRGGELVAVRPGARRARLAFGAGHTALAITNPWRADLVSAFVSVGSPDIETLASFPATARFLMAWPRFTSSWLGRRLVERTIAGAPAGPSEAERAAGRTRVLVHAVDGARRVAVALHGPEAYDFTARTAAAIAARVLAGAAVPGFATPSMVLPWPQLLALEGVAEVPA
ncbi:MAG TPA: saccharopine dehydrogenase NADP-binding domain-containing protein [Kofleriaceae bacterium]|nr:saccharopine dehydrogenase NADP-binding domain-containing protein [Kofleriaceae bacterium]